MDLKNYYKTIREVESKIVPLYVVLVSLETPDGGKAGVCAEAAKPVAARMIAEGRGRLATEPETQEFHDKQAASRRESEALAASLRMQVMLVPSDARVSKSPKGLKD